MVILTKGVVASLWRTKKERRLNQKKKIRTAMPFKEEIYFDIDRMIKERFPSAVTTKDKELIAKTDIGNFILR